MRILNYYIVRSAKFPEINAKCALDSNNRGADLKYYPVYNKYYLVEFTHKMNLTWNHDIATITIIKNEILPYKISVDIIGKTIYVAYIGKDFHKSFYKKYVVCETS